MANSKNTKLKVSKAENVPAKKKGRKQKTLEESIVEIESKKALIKSIIDNGTWAKLRDIATLIPKTMAEEMGFNHTRLVSKMRIPVNLSAKDVIRMAYYFEVDPQLIFNQLLKDVNSNKELINKLSKFKSIKEIRAKK
ncbi:MAG TPA: hypothetical protein VM802_08325 [Chitinophaga sp.]|uniref:hypothetical protein n=1 Tax=Chitinophaga sp. TaxID=1869181 RepID=UPI002C6A2915|nr:hypothetical protein [Chitinophaga sp.]HVI44862.1 hypothetical protein [Chitinophaga sp.]